MKMRIITIEKYTMDGIKTNTIMKMHSGNREMYFVKNRDFQGFISGWEYKILREYYKLHGHVEIEKSNMEISNISEIKNILGGE